MDGSFPRTLGCRETYGIDIYNKYLLMSRAIHRNPKDFPDPDRFYPDRYLKENRLPYPNEKGYNTFGWGRRGILEVVACADIQSVLGKLSQNKGRQSRLPVYCGDLIFQSARVQTASLSTLISSTTRTG